MGKIIKSTTIHKLDNFNLVPDAAREQQKNLKYSFTEFDKNGNVLMEIKYNAEGNAEEKYMNTFDEKGRLIEEIYYLTEDEIAEHKTYEYDDEGKVWRAFKHYVDGSEDVTDYKYDDEGKVIEKVTTDSDGEMEEKEVFSYKNGKLESRELFESGELTFRETFAFDESGNLIETSSYHEDDGTTRYTHAYNEKGILIKTLKYNDEDQLVAKSEYILTEAGKISELVEETRFGKSITKLVYDERGNAIEQIETNEKGEINSRAIRKYNENDDVVESSVDINFYGNQIDQHYTLKYEYTYFD